LDLKSPWSTSFPRAFEVRAEIRTAVEEPRCDRVDEPHDGHSDQSPVAEIEGFPGNFEDAPIEEQHDELDETVGTHPKDYERSRHLEECRVSYQCRARGVDRLTCARVCSRFAI
jgi:hypothetical protein